MTKFDLIKFNKAKYAEIELEISKMPEGLAKEVKQEMILAWVKGNNWMGGLNDTKASRLIERISKLGYTVEEIIDEFHRQTEQYM